MVTTDFDYDSDLFEDEAARVIAWRQRRLLVLGYPLAGATLLACAPMDIHEVERLIKRGCPLDLAVKIAS